MHMGRFWDRSHILRVNSALPGFLVICYSPLYFYCLVK